MIVSLGGIGVFTIQNSRWFSVIEHENDGNRIGDGGAI